MKHFLYVALTAATFACLQQSKAQNTSPYWSLAGNSNATSTSKLGTTNGINLRLYTNNSERVRILSSNGYVGIGTTSPTERLHINSASGANAFRAQVNGNTKLLVASNGGVAVGANVTPPTNGLYVSGNVGIGTSGPLYKLHVVGKSRFTDSVTIGEGGLRVSSSVGVAITGYGSNVGISGSTEGYEDNDVGVAGQGYGYGVQGSGYNYGMYGNGLTGVYGYGDNYGLYGIANSVGVYGQAGLGYGVYGWASTGVYGQGDDYGGDFTGSNDAGVRASTTYGAYAGKFYGAVYASGGFVTSDKNLKKDISEFGDAITLINQLKPRRYDFTTDAKFAFLHLPKGQHYGLLAQDVETILPELVSTADHKIPTTPAQTKAQKPVSKEATTPPVALKAGEQQTVSIKAVNYVELIPILVKAVQEQQQEIETLKKTLQQLTRNQSGTTSTSLGTLSQNTPNPAKNSTRIAYALPDVVQQAQLQVFDNTGKLVKTISLHASGTIDVNTTALSSGVYNYSLVVNGAAVETRKLIVAH